MRRRIPLIARGLLTLGAITTGCVADETPGPRTFSAEASAIAVLPDDTLIYATLDGEVRTESGERIAEIEVSTDGQRGLLGLATTADGRVFAAATPPDERLTVFELSTTDEPHRVVWAGPATVRGGNGGRLRALADGRLLLGVGLLNDRPGQADPTSTSGKLVTLDPDGSADQSPDIISGPWNNPFAFDQAPTGEVWVADNHPQDGEERLARGDDGFDPATVAVMPADSAPSGLAAIGDELVVCSYNTGELLRYSSSGEPLGSLATDCLLDVTTVGDDLIAYSTGIAVTVIRIPG